MSATKKHPYHLVDPSPWPVVGALSAFVIAIGAVMAMHHHGSYVFFGVLSFFCSPCSGGGAT